MITVYTHDDCLAHDPGAHHPESPNRLRVILNELMASYLADSIAITDAPLGTDQQIALAHTSYYRDHVKQSAPVTNRVPLDGDTVMSPGSLEAALRGVGAACQGVDDLLTGETSLVFCATRPPGHHATSANAMGFCIFNNVAIAALYAQQQSIKRIAIVDFDVHHGNGSQDIIAGKPDLLYVSTHQSPLYPGSGSTTENIPGNIVNIPLPAGTDGESYRTQFEENVLSELEKFKPELLLVSAGFDAHYQDPLASMNLTEEDYQWIGQKLKIAADNFCKGRILSVLEGGYNLDVLGASVLAYLDGLSDTQSLGSTA